MIFLTVGTQFGFDRLVKAVDEAVEKKLIVETVYAQIGPGAYLPRRMDYVVYLDKENFDKTFDSCQGMISHAGMGNISLSLKTGKPLMVMPRLRQYGEHVNDHQLETAQKFEKLGHVIVAYHENELPEKLELLKTFKPNRRVPNRQGVIDRIGRFLSSV